MIKYSRRTLISSRVGKLVNVFIKITRYFGWGFFWIWVRLAFIQKIIFLQRFCCNECFVVDARFIRSLWTLSKRLCQIWRQLCLISISIIVIKKLYFFEMLLGYIYLIFLFFSSFSISSSNPRNIKERFNFRILIIIVLRHAFSLGGSVRSSPTILLLLLPWELISVIHIRRFELFLDLFFVYFEFLFNHSIVKLRSLRNGSSRFFICECRNVSCAWSSVLRHNSSSLTLFWVLSFF